MDKPQEIVIKLLSDSTIGTNYRTSGRVDIEIDYTDEGLPIIRGKIIHGLLRDSWLSMAKYFKELQRAAERILGPEGGLMERAILRIGDATLNEDVIKWAHYAVNRRENPLHPMLILESLTDVRTQTSIDQRTGSAKEGSLRSSRVILRETEFYAPLQWYENPTEDDLCCLLMCVWTTRHAGLGRNRGRGFIQMNLKPIDEQLLFKQIEKRCKGEEK